MAEKKQKQFFYSKIPNFTISFKKGELANVEGVMKRVGEKIIHFSGPLGGHGFYATDDPEEIEFLSNRPGILSNEEYAEQCIPAEQKIGTLKRDLEEQNRLIADLQRQLDEKAAASAPKKGRAA